VVVFVLLGWLQMDSSADHPLCGDEPSYLLILKRAMDSPKSTHNSSRIRISLRGGGLNKKCKL
jgi:hypothetical protein